MDGSVLVSIVVPVYDVEKYIEECVESILAQTYRSFELILVDDGSPDRCGLICDKYVEQDERIKVIHKDNGGLSDARNVGIEAASGTYITFIDSDDTISEDYLERMLYQAKSQNVEVVQGSIAFDKSSLGSVDGSKEKIYRGPNEVMRDYLLFRHLEGYACNKLYSMRLFKTLRYPVGKIQEDAWTTYKALYEAKGVAVIGVQTYYYRVNDSSIMNGSFRPQRFDIMDVPNDIRDYLQAAGDTYDYNKEFDYYTMRIGFKTYNDCIMKGQEKANQKKMDELRDTIRQLPRNKELWGRKYIKMVQLLSAAPGLYLLMIRYLRKKKKGRNI